jgi:magnesium transporter
MIEDASIVVGDESWLSRAGLKWVDVTGPTEASLEPLMRQFGLHRLAIEDCLHLDQRPKMDSYRDHQFVVIQGFCLEEGAFEPTLHELHCFLGKDWLITVHDDAEPAIESLKIRLTAAQFSLGADHLLYLVADALVDNQFPITDRLNERIDELESLVFQDPAQKHLQEVLALKRTLSFMRRVLSPQRDVIGLMTRGGVMHIGEHTTVYFRDVYDHLIRIHEQLDTARDLLGNAMDAYLSVVANKTNEVTKQLTIFASIFLPLSFVVGFFGQNFEVLSHFPAFLTMLALMISVPTFMLWWFKRQGWF